MSYTRREHRTYEAMYTHTSRHGIKRALKKMAAPEDEGGEDARTIFEALDHVSDDRLARYLARALASRGR
jgi:hypothetical protein